ncbi:MAG: hypothetical protein K9M02_06085 [Thiohalocapsa sp.]|nr:hypothetical protein [Thiohalocapsa sp.]
MSRYTLRLTGDLLPGATRGDALATLAELLRLTLAEADTALNGKPKKIEGELSREEAEETRLLLVRAGIGCHVEEGAPEPASAASAFDQPLDMDMTSVEIRCPKCDQLQPPGAVCAHCGIVYAKYEQIRKQAVNLHRPAPRASADEFPYHTVNRLLLLVFLGGVGLAIWSHWQKDLFPRPDFYDLSRLEEPRQTPTDARPFQVEANSITYTIDPKFDYALDGVVVSLHDSDSIADIYHFKDWKDFINIRDLCVVWGENVATGAFRDMHYKNSTWTCWISASDREAAGNFAWNQLSNNHVLVHDEILHDAIKSAEIGDQIHLRGKLAGYSHAGGFRRGTSTTRDDTGNGACETIYVEDFEIVRKSNPGWRLINLLSTWISVLAFIGLAIIFFVAPYRPRR